MNSVSKPKIEKHDALIHLDENHVFKMKINIGSENHSVDRCIIV